MGILVVVRPSVTA